MSDIQATSKAPSHYVYHVRDGKGSKGYFTKIGAAWAHKDGRGFSVQIESVPLDGRISLRTVDEQKN